MKVSLFYLPSIGSRAEINGFIPHARLAWSIEAFATHVLPRVV